LKTSPIKTEERSVLSRSDFKFDKEGAVCRDRGNLFQPSTDLIKSEEKNLAKPIICYCKMDKGTRNQNNFHKRLEIYNGVNRKATCNYMNK
jgi:hypothetical protein